MSAIWKRRPSMAQPWNVWHVAMNPIRRAVRTCSKTYMWHFGAVWRRRGKVLLTREHEQVMESLEAYRAELQRRRSYYLGAWRWSLWPLIPATAVVLAGEMLYDERPGKWLRLSLAALVCVLGSLLGAWVYARKGKEFQRELDALTTLDKK